MNTCPYNPLSLPVSRTRREKIDDFLLTGFRRSTRARRLLAQMQVRVAVPSEAWGPDPERYILAGKVGAIIQEEIKWLNANFIPEDPMRLVLFKLDTEGLFWDNMELTCIFLDLEDLVGGELTVEEIQHMYDGTFGEAVDLLWDIKRNFCAVKK